MQRIFPEILAIATRKYNDFIAEKKNLSALKNLSRRFYGKNIEVRKCLPNAQKYTAQASSYFFHLGMNSCDFGVAFATAACRNPDNPDALFFARC